MWICLNDSFLSIVSHHNDPSKLLVRARIGGHIENVFPGATVYARAHSDYLYRADIDRATVVAAIGKRLDTIKYTNFKNSVKNNALHDAYAGFWNIMYRLQFVFKPKVPAILAPKVIQTKRTTAAVGTPRNFTTKDRPQAKKVSKPVRASGHEGMSMRDQWADDKRNGRLDD